MQAPNAPRHGQGGASSSPSGGGYDNRGGGGGYDNRGGGGYDNNRGGGGGGGYDNNRGGGGGARSSRDSNRGGGGGRSSSNEDGSEIRELFRRGPQNHGNGALQFAWQPQGNFLATGGASGVVHIWDRHGEFHAEVPPVPIGSGTGAVMSLEWDRGGDCLAVLQNGSSIVPIWDLNAPSESSVTRLETGLKDLSYLSWARSSNRLVIGTGKGNILVYDRELKRKMPVLGKHPKRITCGAWSSSNQLALGSDDATLTLSDERGDTKDQLQLKSAPFEMCFARQRSDSQQVRRAVAAVATTPAHPLPPRPTTATPRRRPSPSTPAPTRCSCTTSRTRTTRSSLRSRRTTGTSSSTSGSTTAT